MLELKFKGRLGEKWSLINKLYCVNFSLNNSEDIIFVSYSLQSLNKFTITTFECTISLCTVTGSPNLCPQFVAQSKAGWFPPFWYVVGSTLSGVRLWKSKLMHFERPKLFGDHYMQWRFTLHRKWTMGSSSCSSVCLTRFLHWFLTLRCQCLSS